MAFFAAVFFVVVFLAAAFVAVVSSADSSAGDAEAFLAAAVVTFLAVEVAARVRLRWGPCWAEAWGVDPDVLEDTNYLSCRLRGAARPVHVKSRVPIVTRA